MWGVPKSWGIPNSWLVYNGKSENNMDLGVPHFIKPPCHEEILKSRPMGGVQKPLSSLSKRLIDTGSHDGSV